VLKSSHVLGEKILKIRSPFESEIGVRVDGDAFTNRICVFKVPKSIQNDQLAEIFKQFGPILKVFIKKTKYKLTNHAFITFLCRLSVLKALQQKKLTVMQNHQLSIVEYKRKERKHPRVDGLKGGAREEGSPIPRWNDSKKLEKSEYLEQRKFEIEEEKKNTFLSSNETDDKKIKKVLFHQKEDFLKQWYKKIQLQNPEMKPLVIKNYEILELFYHNKNQNSKKSLINYNSIVKRFSKRINKNHKIPSNIHLTRRKVPGPPFKHPQTNQNAPIRAQPYQERSIAEQIGRQNWKNNNFYMIDNHAEERFKSRAEENGAERSFLDRGNSIFIVQYDDRQNLRLKRERMD